MKPIEMIAEMRQQAGLSIYALATRAHVDERYLTRLEQGEKQNPSRDVLIKLTRALVAYTSLFSEKDVHRVLKAAGFAPPPDR